MTVSCWKDRIRCQTISFLLSPTSCHGTSLFLRFLFSRTVYTLVRAFSSLCIHLSDSNRESTVSGTVLETRGVFYKINNSVPDLEKLPPYQEGLHTSHHWDTAMRDVVERTLGQKAAHGAPAHGVHCPALGQTRDVCELLHWKSSDGDTVCLA